MKKTVLLSSILLACVSVLFADEDTPLEKQMQLMARSMKQLSQQITDPAKNHDSITLIETLKQAAATSMDLKPKKTSSIPAVDQQQFLTEYKAQISKLSEAFNRIEEALKAGKNDQAKTLLSTVGAIKKDGHAKFKQD